MPAIIDNQDKFLTKELKSALSEQGKRLDSSVGYFNLRGWGKIAQTLADLPETPAVRLLIGMSNSPHNRLQAMLSTGQHKEKHLVEVRNQVAQQEQEERNIAQQLTWSIPTQDDAAALQSLNCLLKQNKVQVRFYGLYPLHAKLYLCHRDISKSEIIAYTGSSNLTLAGLEGQGELNVEISDIDMTRKLQDWFDRRWDEAAEYEITEFIAEIIEKSWASQTLPDPYLVHLKLAYHLSQDARDGLAEYALPGPLKKKLLDFQAQAVKIAARNMMSRGGAMIGDVVGLGKTLMATAAAKILEEMHNHETLVICPKNLREMWQSYLHEYELRGQVMSIGETQNHLEPMPRYRTLIIDESHNFRNRGGKRWNAVRDYISRNEPKVLLLTATPFNLKMTDLGGQLGLFISEDEILEVAPKIAIDKLGEYEFNKRCDGNPFSLKAFELSEEAQDWQELLTNYMIRRTRSFIEKNHAEQDLDDSGKPTGRRYFRFASDDKKHYLPRRTPKPTEVELAAGDPAEDMQSDKTIDEIESLNLPRFGWSTYVSDDLREQATPAEQAILDRSKANGRSLRGLTRTSLYKRLSSSAIAFELSVQRHLIKNIVAKLCLEANEPIPTSNYEIDLDTDTDADSPEHLFLDDDLESDAALSETFTKLSTEDIRAKAAEIRQGLSSNKRVQYLSPELFQDATLIKNKTDLLSHLNHDIGVLEGMLNRFDPVLAETDSKIREIQHIICEQYPKEKIAIFTEYADTAYYLGQALEQMQIEGGVGTVTGSSDDPLEIAKRFSPKSTGATASADTGTGEEGELRILVSTDVLSEGMNLQDARIIINYDLPWAIIKLIQRAGRVDRIGQEAEEVIVYSLLPSEGIDSTIKLHEKLQQRLINNAELVGSDEVILGHQGETSGYREFLEEGKLSDQDGFGVDYVSLAFEIWDSAEPEHQQAAHDLSEPAISSVKSADAPGSQAGALAYAKLNYVQGSTNAITFAKSDESAQHLSPHRALEITKCKPDTPPAEQQPDFYGLLEVATALGKSLDALTAESNLTGIGKRVRDKLKEYLDGTKEGLFVNKEAIELAFDQLGQFPLQEAAKQSLSSSLREKDERLLLDNVSRLLEENRLIIDTKKEVGEYQLICSMGYTK